MENHKRESCTTQIYMYDIVIVRDVTRALGISPRSTSKEWTRSELKSIESTSEARNYVLWTIELTVTQRRSRRAAEMEVAVRR